MKIKIILAIGLILLLLVTGCGETNLLTGSSAAIPGTEPPTFNYENETLPAEEKKDILTGTVD